MKKFLKLQLPASPEKLPPADIDAAILAAGAIKARRIRCKKTAVKMLPAIGLTSAAAAAAGERPCFLRLFLWGQIWYNTV